MRRIAVVLLAVSLVIAGCSDSWTSEDYSAVVSYCSGVADEPAGCPEVVSAIRTDECSVEDATRIIALIAREEVDDAILLWTSCPGYSTDN
jgi:hypothetical protein